MASNINEVYSVADQGAIEMEEFLLRVAWSRAPDHQLRCGQVTADVGLPCPNPPSTNEEMQQVTYAAKMAMLKCLRRRKSK